MDKVLSESRSHRGHASSLLGAVKSTVQVWLPIVTVILVTTALMAFLFWQFSVVQAREGLADEGAPGVKVGSIVGGSSGVFLLLAACVVGSVAYFKAPGSKILKTLESRSEHGPSRPKNVPYVDSLNINDVPPSKSDDSEDQDETSDPSATSATPQPENTFERDFSQVINSADVPNEDNPSLNYESKLERQPFRTETGQMKPTQKPREKSESVSVPKSDVPDVHDGVSAMNNASSGESGQSVGVKPSSVSGTNVPLLQDKNEVKKKKVQQRRVFDEDYQQHRQSYNVEKTTQLIKRYTLLKATYKNALSNLKDLDEPLLGSELSYKTDTSPESEKKTVKVYGWFSKELNTVLYACKAIRKRELSKPLCILMPFNFKSKNWELRPVVGNEDEYVKLTLTEFEDMVSLDVRVEWLNYVLNEKEKLSENKIH